MKNKVNGITTVSTVVNAGSTSQFFSSEEINGILSRIFSYEDEVALLKDELQRNIASRRRHPSDVCFITQGRTPSGEVIRASVWELFVKAKSCSTEEDRRDFFANPEEWREIADEAANHIFKTVASTMEKDVINSFMALHEEGLLKDTGFLSFEEYCKFIQNLQRVVEKEFPMCSSKKILRDYLKRLVGPYAMPQEWHVRNLDDLLGAIAQKRQRIENLRKQGQGSSAKCAKLHRQLKELYVLRQTMQDYNKEHCHIVVIDNECEEYYGSLASMKESSFKEIQLRQLERGDSLIAKRYRRYISYLSK